MRLTSTNCRNTRLTESEESFDVQDLPTLGIEAEQHTLAIYALVEVVAEVLQTVHLPLVDLHRIVFEAFSARQRELVLPADTHAPRAVLVERLSRFAEEYRVAIAYAAFAFVVPSKHKHLVFVEL